MKLANKIRQIFRISIIKTIYYNFLCSRVKRKKGFLLIFKGVSLNIQKRATLIVENGTCFLGYGQTSFSKIPSLIRLNEGSKFLVHGRTIIEYGADVLLKNGAIFEMGKNSYINCNCFIRCHKHIVLSDEVLISNGLNIRDSDGHKINGVCKEQDVIINNHVWIGTNVTILKGVIIHSGVVVGANSLITKDIPANSLAYGNPATVHKKDIEWDYS